MKIIFEDVFERDIDLLMISIFSSSENIVKKFVQELEIDDYCNCTIKSIEHSYADKTGESDITIIVEVANKKHGILIENKIDAIPQDKQAIRYYERGNNGIKEGKYNSFSVVLIAPIKYLNADTQNYGHKISYERIIEIIGESDLSNKPYAIELLKSAIKKQEKGYTMVPHQGATDFYNEYISCWMSNGFDKVGNLATKGGKNHPLSGGWIEYKTEIKGLQIIHKSDRGFIDLEFSRCKGKGAEIQCILREVVDDLEKYQIVDTGKSASVRIKKKPLAPDKHVAEQEDDVIDSMRAVLALTELSRRIDRRKVEELLASVRVS